MKLKSNRIIVSLGALTSCALWGISTPIVKMGYAYVDASHIPSLLLWVGIQFLIAGFLTFLVDSIFSKKLVYPKKKSVKGVFLISLCQTVLQYSILYVGLMYTTSVKGAILKSTDVFLVALIASLIFRIEKLTLKKILSCVIGFAGIIIMNLDGLSLNVTIGDGLVVLAITCYSFGVVFTKIFAKDEDAIVLSAYQMSLGGAVMLLIGIALGGRIAFASMLPIIICLSVIYAVSYTLWAVLLKKSEASTIIIFSFVTPVFGVIFSELLLNEEGGVALPNLVIALVLVSVGIILNVMKGKRIEKGN